MKKLYRSATDKYVFGILGGLGDYFQVDSTLLRLAFVFFVLVTGFFPGGLAYLVAYFIVPDRLMLSGIAKRRLKALQKFTDLGAGFQIAFEDLQIRGAGNLLGEQQHGYISSIGFDLYCRMLKESVANIAKEMGKTNATAAKIH